MKLTYTVVHYIDLDELDIFVLGEFNRLSKLAGGIDANGKINAIKYLRQKYSLGLKEAKDVTDSYWEQRFPKVI